MQQITTTQHQQADRYTFTDTQAGNIRIVFLPQTLRHNRKIPQLDYQGSEGKFTFQGNEVKQQQSNLGLLISVTLKANPKSGGLDFALILPSVNLVEQKRQDFETVAIATTKSQKIVGNRAVTEFTYKVFTLKGVAEKLSVVASGSVPSALLKDYQSPTTWQEDEYSLVDLHRF